MNKEEREAIIDNGNTLDIDIFKFQLDHIKVWTCVKNYVNTIIAVRQ